MTRHIILDISRTLSRAAHAVPTGIDRVEMAYADHLLTHEGHRLGFGAMHPIGRYGRLPTDAVRRFIALTRHRWASAEGGHDQVRAAARQLQNAILLDGPWRGRRAGGSARRAAYLNVSHHHLDRPAVLGAAIRPAGVAFVCLLHDLIPIEFPEYSRPNEPERHARRIGSVARLADGIMCASEATRRAVEPHLRAAGRAPPLLVAPLGVDHVSPAPAPATRPASFVMLATIEPRKNHLMLLHVWRRIAEAQGADAPRLIVVGRRGWENENVLDMLERCPALRGLVEEHNAMPDQAVRALLASASALLLPSFAEGYGLPVAEALAQGVPVLCSDLPALREVGGDVPEYLDPLDGPAWTRAILDYARPGSERREWQLARLAGWTPPTWPGHMAAALDFIDHGLPDRAERALDVLAHAS